MFERHDKTAYILYLIKLIKKQIEYWIYICIL